MATRRELIEAVGQRYRCSDREDKLQLVRLSSDRLVTGMQFPLHVLRRLLQRAIPHVVATVPGRQPVATKLGLRRPCGPRQAMIITSTMPQMVRNVLLTA
ncbi:hypothetical protein OKW43_000097 [Paraburkholderia sp. WC7.3g]